MSFEVSFFSGPSPVTIVTTHGDIDASNYRELIEIVQKLFQNGTRDLLLDLGDTQFVSSSGMVALHSISLLMNGGKPLNVEDGWSALHEMSSGPGAVQAHLKLLNVRPRVDRTLDISGLKPFYEIFSDKGDALNSFQPKKEAPASS
jgi:anti-anti-sigma factor